MVEEINKTIKEYEKEINTDLISDGWHTFGELYFHRSLLFITLCKLLSKESGFTVYKSKKHFDGSSIADYFNLGIILKDNSYIAYHLPIAFWEECFFADVYEKSPINGKYTSEDAINNLCKI